MFPCVHQEMETEMGETQGEVVPRVHTDLRQICRLRKLSSCAARPRYGAVENAGKGLATPQATATLVDPARFP